MTPEAAQTLRRRMADGVGVKLTLASGRTIDAVYVADQTDDVWLHVDTLDRPARVRWENVADLEVAGLSSAARRAMFVPDNHPLAPQDPRLRAHTTRNS